MNYTDQQICDVFGCTEVIRQGDAVWISGGTTAGRWLHLTDYDMMAQHYERLAKQAAATHPPLPPHPKVKRKASVRVEQLSPKQKQDASLMAFAILISGNIQTGDDALRMAALVIKLADKARTNVKRYKLHAEAPTQSLTRRLRTLRTHIDGIIDGIQVLNGTRELHANVGDNGAISLVYGQTQIILGE